jgi:hypothetical protein
MPRPDTAGFADAQDRLRQELGVDAVFLIPTALVWPPGTPLDPETGKPFDPFLDPVDPAANTEVTVRCSFVHSPLIGIDPAASAGRRRRPRQRGADRAAGQLPDDPRRNARCDRRGHVGHPALPLRPRAQRAALHRLLGACLMPPTRVTREELGRAVRHRLPARADFHRPRLPERDRVALVEAFDESRCSRRRWTSNYLAIGFNFDDGGDAR